MLPTQPPSSAQLPEGRWADVPSHVRRWTQLLRRTSPAQENVTEGLLHTHSPSARSTHCTRMHTHKHMHRQCTRKSHTPHRYTIPYSPRTKTHTPHIVHPHHTQTLHRHTRVHTHSCYAHIITTARTLTVQTICTHAHCTHTRPRSVSPPCDRMAPKSPLCPRSSNEDSSAAKPTGWPPASYHAPARFQSRLRQPHILIDSSFISSLVSVIRDYTQVRPDFPPRINHFRSMCSIFT